MVTVHRSFNPVEAEVIRSRLEAAQFHPVITHGLSALSIDGYSLAAGGSLVQVPDEEAGDARALIKSVDEEQGSAE
jgi:hypothetical protein